MITSGHLQNLFQFFQYPVGKRLIFGYGTQRLCGRMRNTLACAACQATGARAGASPIGDNLRLMADPLARAIARGRRPERCRKGEPCHAERSEASLCPSRQSLRGVYTERSECAQGGNPHPYHTRPGQPCHSCRGDVSPFIPKRVWINKTFYCYLSKRFSSSCIPPKRD
jgi:hypothetical protein